MPVPNISSVILSFSDDVVLEYSPATTLDSHRTGYVNGVSRRVDVKASVQAPSSSVRQTLEPGVRVDDVKTFFVDSDSGLSGLQVVVYDGDRYNVSEVEDWGSYMVILGLRQVQT